MEFGDLVKILKSNYQIDEIGLWYNRIAGTLHLYVYMSGKVTKDMAENVIETFENKGFEFSHFGYAGRLSMVFKKKI